MNQGILSSLYNDLKTIGILIEPEWDKDFVLRNGAQWFCGKSWEYNGKTYYKCWYGDYKHDVKREWKSYDKLSKEENESAEIHINEILTRERLEREKVQIETAVEVQKEWQTLQCEGSSRYIERKGIKELFGARIKENPNGSPVLYVPLRDTDGVLWNCQRIFGEKLSEGDKFFIGGAKIDTCFFELDDGSGSQILNAERIYVAEGFATAATIKEAFPEVPVVAAFTANNLKSVCLAIKEKNPSCSIVVCADNDCYTVIRDKPVNVGIDKGRIAAGAAKGKIVYPVFKYPQKGLTDFNDLMHAEGIATVRDQILHPEKYLKGLQPLPLDVSRNGKQIVPTEKEVSEHLLEFFKGRIIRQDKSVFTYDGTHWTELSVTGVDRIKQMTQIAANGLLGSRDMDAYYKYFLVHMPVVPRGTNFFQPNPYAANFRNGTLHTWRRGTEYFTELKPHSPEDFLTNVLPFDCPAWAPGDELPPAPLFDQMVETLWADNGDKSQVKDLAEELIGAALMPAFPIMVFYFGAPNKGKSTFIKLIIKLVSQENICSVQPCDMTGFNMESMIGKLVNFDTDIDTNKPIHDSEVKKLIDRMPRRIRRKGISDVYAYLPAIHLFASNRIPKSLDGSSHAYGRRLILIKTESMKLEGAPTIDYENIVLEQEMEGILARGLRGLHRLIANHGLYTRPENSKEVVKKMEMGSDILGQFFADIEHGEVRTDKSHTIVLESQAKIERKVLWETFNNWQDEALVRGNLIGKHDFFDKLEHKGFHLKTVKGIRKFQGIGLKVDEDPIA